MYPATALAKTLHRVILRKVWRLHFSEVRLVVRHVRVVGLIQTEVAPRQELRTATHSMKMVAIPHSPRVTRHLPAFRQSFVFTRLLVQICLFITGSVKNLYLFIFMLKYYSIHLYSYQHLLLQVFTADYYKQISLKNVLK